MISLNFRLATALAICVSLSVWTPSLAQGPSFDCKKATHADEVSICGSPTLSWLDRIAATGYEYVKDRFGRRYADQIGVAARERRSACRSDVNCIQQAQIEAIKSYQSSGAPVAIPNEIGSGSSEEPGEAHQTGTFDSGIKECDLTIHGITAISGQCYVQITYDSQYSGPGLELHAESLSAYRYRQAHPEEEELPTSQQHCKGPWINIFTDNSEGKKPGYAAYWGEGCHGNETVTTISVGRNHFRGTNYEFEFYYKPLR